jgi:hypothetical protein
LQNLNQRRFSAHTRCYKYSLTWFLLGATEPLSLLEKICKFKPTAKRHEVSWFVAGGMLVSLMNASSRCFVHFQFFDALRLRQSNQNLP